MKGIGIGIAAGVLGAQLAYADAPSRTRRWM